MKTIILYGSIYGSARLYAEKFAEQAGFPVMSYADAEDPEAYDRVVYFGSLYSGAVTGLRATAPKIRGELILVGVGLMDPTQEHSVLHFEKSTRKQLPEGLRESARLFLLRGCIDYSLLSKKHRLMMAGLCTALRMKSNRNAADQMILDTFGGHGDFTDFEALTPILEAVR